MTQSTKRLDHHVSCVSNRKIKKFDVIDLFQQTPRWHDMNLDIFELDDVAHTIQIID